MEYSISENENPFEIRVSGIITRKKVYECWNALMSHPGYPSAQVVLVTFENTPKWDITGSEMANLARDVVRLRALKWGFVCPEMLSFGMCRMFATLAEGPGTYDVFSTAETARDWARLFISGERPE